MKPDDDDFLNPAPDNDDENDAPLDLDAVDQQIRINRKREEIDELAGGEAFSFRDPEADDLDPELEEAFLDNVLAYEKASWEAPMAFLTRAGLVLPPPDELDDASLAPKIMEIAEELGRRSFFLYHTNHLSDRELYEHVWNDMLQEEVVIMPGQGNWNHDILGSWGEEQMQDWLRYYATEEERRDHLAKYPEDTLPPREKCVADRDQHFPQHP